MPGIAHYKNGDVLISGTLFSEYKSALDKNATNTTTKPYFLAQIPDVSDLLAGIRTIYGANMTTFKIDNTDLENREVNRFVIFCN